MFLTHFFYAILHIEPSTPTYETLYMLYYTCLLNPLYPLYPLYDYTHIGHREVLQILLSSGAYVNQLTTDAFTPLMLACSGGFADVVLTLIGTKGVDLSTHSRIFRDQHSGYSALHLAVLGGNVQVLSI
jgi:ankyrin repeat protein